MHYRRLGRSGLKVSEISIGAWVTFGGQVGEKEADDLIHAAYDQGVNFFDNADMYAGGLAETLMGAAVRDLPREALVLSSKVFWPTMPGPNGRGLSRKHIFESVHASLRRLGVDYLDLYFCHRFDPDTPVDEVVWAMNDLIRQGKILYWGTSEWEPAQIVEAVGVARTLNLIGPAMEQPKYNLLHRARVENHLMPVCRDQGIGLTTFSPLESGILSGKYNNGIPAGSRASLDQMVWLRDRLSPPTLAAIRQLTALAVELECTTAQLAIAWILRRKEVSSVITGATTLDQLDENLGAADCADTLGEDQIDRIFRIISPVADSKD
jgi:voltage-dependent potassium channel beta subunit